MITANTLEHMDRISADAEARGADKERKRLRSEVERRYRDAETDQGASELRRLLCWLEAES